MAAASDSHCALCGAEGDLRDSHYLAAAFFRRMHTRNREKIRPPISVNGARAMYDCKQPQTKLLCASCEHKFKIGGEDWVIKCTCQKDGSFPLRDILVRIRPQGIIGRPPRAYM